MMKLVIGFDEIGFNPENTDVDMAYPVDQLYDFLANQFPEWNTEECFDVEGATWDFDNNEVHIDFPVT